MPPEFDLAQYLQTHSVPDNGQQWITNAINGPPARRVTAGYSRNSRYLFPSTKSGYSLQAESRLEFRYLVMCEYSQDVILARCQPGFVSICRHTKSGRTTSRNYVPDFLLLTQSEGPIVVEIKSAEKLAQLCNLYPRDWVREENKYRYVPAINALRDMGLKHITVTDSDLHPIHNANLRLLLTLRDERLHIGVDLEELKRAVTRCLDRTCVISLQQLADELDIIDLTPLLMLLDQGFLYADLERSLLSVPQTALVSTSPNIVAAMQESPDHSPLLKAASECTAISVSLPSMAALKKGQQYVEDIKAGKISRHLYRVKKSILAGKEDNSSELLAACPNYSRRGYRRDEIGVEHRAFIKEAIDEYYLDGIQRTGRAAHNAYCAKLTKSRLAFKPVSEPTFVAIIKKIRPELIGMARGGRRLRNSMANPTPVQYREVSVCPTFAEASIDHHLLKNEAIVARSVRKSFTARIWVTAMVDRGSKAILAIWISFNSPSRQALGMVLRECVRKYGMLPRMIFYDGGPEFRCPYIEQLYSHVGGGVSQHPAADGRSGSEVERPFGLFDTEWGVHRPGRVTSLADRRSISSTHSASQNAELDVHDTWSEILAYIEHQNSRCIGDSEFAPIAVLQEGLLRFPSVPIRQAMDDEFVILSSVDCREFTLDQQRGIHIGNRWFSHPRLFDPVLTKSKIHARIDPGNPYKVYAKVNNEWIACLSRGHDEFLMLPATERESTAIRMVQGHARRESARKDDQVVFVEQLHEIDARRKAGKLGYPQDEVGSDFLEHEEVFSELSSLFSEAQNQTLDPIVPLAKTLRSY